MSRLLNGNRYNQLTQGPSQGNLQRYPHGAFAAYRPLTCQRNPQLLAVHRTVRAADAHELLKCRVGELCGHLGWLDF